MTTLNSIIIDFFLNPWFLLSLLFWLIVLVLVYLLRNKKEAVYLFFPLLVMFKTKRLNNFIKKISRKAPKFWKVFWTVGIFISFGITIFALYFFFINFINLIIRPKIEQAIIPLIPGVTINLPLYFYMILPLVFVITTHEFAHGISAGSEDIDVKSTGVLGAGLFFIIGFGAFVEVDERELNSIKIHRNTRLRIAGAGTYVNAITALVAFILILCFPLIISPNYRQVTQVRTVLKTEEGGFNYGNLSSGDVILAIKKEDASDDQYINLDDYKGYTLSNILYNKTGVKFSIGDNLTFKIYNPSKDTYLEKNIVLGPRYNIGIRYKYNSNGTAFEITKIYLENEGGNNYNKNLSVGLVIKEVNGNPINLSIGNSLEKVLTIFNLKSINLTTDSETYILDVDVDGVLIGIQSNSYFMYKNQIAKFFTSFFPEFLIRELSWLFIIAFSVTLFNTLPLPVFDGDRMVKELLNWGFGEKYNSLKKKTDKHYFKSENNYYELSEYRIEKIDTVKILIEDPTKVTEKSEIILPKDKYKLIDKIKDGFNDTLTIDLPENNNIKENTIIEITYQYWYDEKRRIKRILLNSLRLITLFIVVGNFILSFLKFGAFFFWI
ncbi:MAG: site-2 protease family protein [Promethearchaeota archaeon]